MENKVIVQGRVIEVTVIKKTGRMLDWYGVKISTEDGSEVTVECEASELDKRLFPDMKIRCWLTIPIWVRTESLRIALWLKR